MKKILSLVLIAALCTPAIAQKSRGQANAPTIKQSIAVGDVKMSLDYTAISLGGGDTMKMLGDKEKGASSREMWNKMGPTSPVATFSTSVEAKVGDVTLPAGEYQTYFSIGEDLVWSLNFKSGDKVHTTKLALMDNPDASKRLLMCLYAEEAGAGVYLSYGNKMGFLKIAPAAPAPKK